MSDRIRAIIFVLTDLSSSSIQRPPLRPDNTPDIHFYANRNGQIVPLIAGSVPRIVSDGRFMIGVVFDGFLFPIFNRERQWIIVRIADLRNIILTPELYRQYSHLFLHAQEKMHSFYSRNHEANVQHRNN